MTHFVAYNRQRKSERVNDPNFDDQLAALRLRLARIDRKYAAPARPAPRPLISRETALFVEESLNGQEIQTDHGKHFETEKLWERHRRHGSVGIMDLESLPPDLLDPISEGLVRNVAPERWAFLDTETTGLAGGSGTYAFLIGVGRITPGGFQLRQFFMRDYGEEASLLAALAEHLAEFDVLITYNGRTFDVPLLETRYRMARFRPPFERLAHVDLLFGSRRLWKLRFDSCRLVELERQILGVERQGDLPGEMIPYVYFEYVRSREAARVVPILHHNAIDILTLACLTGVVPWAFHSAEKAGLKHGSELVGLARWYRQAEQYDQALDLMRRGITAGLRDDLLFRTMWDIAMLEKKRGQELAALPIFTELTESRNPFRVAAFEELAKHYEHREKNYAMALEMTRAAMEIEYTGELKKREARLERRIASPRSKRLMLQE